MKSENRSRDMRGSKGRGRDDSAFARPNGLRDNAETALSCRRPGPARKKKKGKPVARRGRSRRTNVVL